MLRGVLTGQSDLVFFKVYSHHRGCLVCVASGQSPVSTADLQYILSREINQAMQYLGFDSFWITARDHFTPPLLRKVKHGHYTSSWKGVSEKCR